MFKKKCPKCRNSIGKEYDFCPYCGSSFRSPREREDFGIIGRNDIIESEFFNQPTTFVEKILGRTMKMLEKQMKAMSEEIISDTKKTEKTNFPYPNNLHVQFFVNGKRVFTNQPSSEQKTPEKTKKIKAAKMSEETAKRFAELPRKEAKSKMKRISNKLIYELEVPGVNDLDDVFINRLENSIEVKALGKDKIYSKILNVNLPLIRYGLNNGNLILELAAG